MTGVQFSEDEIARPRAVSAPAASKVAAWLIARGIARTEKEANVMLLAAGGVAAALAVVIFFLSLDSGGAPPVTDAERLRNELSTPVPKP